ncbi:hypothetical protein E2320_011394, partial [Naja naja]
IESRDVGDVYKVRISCDDLVDFEGWHLKSLQMEELHASQEVNFECNCWFSLSQKCKDTVKEFPVVNENQKTLSVHKYVVSVHTGDLWGSETFANIYITVYGAQGDTGVRKLQDSFIEGEKFQRNKVDSFLIEAVSLSHLQKIVVGHDGEGYGAGIYLKMVTIKKSENSDKEWVFPCWNWLDTHMGICDTVCEIKTIGKRRISSSRYSPINQQISDLWIMDITGSEINAETDPMHFTFNFYGDKGHKKLALKLLGKTTQIKLLSILSMYILETGRKLTPVAMLIFVFVEIEVTQENGGLIILKQDQSLLVEDRSVYDQYKVDVYQIKGVHLGKLNQVIVGFKSLNKDDWFLEKIVIEERNYPFTTYTFVHNNWLHQQSKKDFTEASIPLQEMTEKSGPMKGFEAKSQGQWRLWLDYVHVPEKIPEIKILAYGTNGVSLAQRVQHFKNEPFLLNIGDIGQIIKLSFLSSCSNLDKGIKLHKVRMKDLDTKEELGFYPLNQCLFEEDGSETVTELAVVRPNEAPLKEITYSLSVYTGTLPASETDANIFITLFGTNGDSYKRQLKHSKSCPQFEKGQINTFAIQAVDLGMLSSVLVEHNNSGYGAGWYLDQILIQELGKSDSQYVFSCQQWLDSGVGDGKMKQELQLLGKTNKESLTKYVQGTWDVTVITREMSDNYGNSKLILTVCDDKGTSAAVFIPKGSFKMAKIYQTSLELDKKFNKICKIRLEIEDSDRETWYCHEVKLQNKKSKETLEIPCWRDFPDNKGCTVAEFPILITGTRFLTVKQYILYISTDSAPKSGTNSDVYVTLKGTMGDTGRRKLFRNGQECFSEGKVDVFPIEAVDIGTLYQLIVEKGKGSAWHLQKIMVKEPQCEGKETLFMTQTWLKDTLEKKKYASLTLNATEVLDRGTASLLSSQNMKSEGLWKISCTTCREDSSKAFEESWENITKLIWVFYGNSGKSEPISLTSKTGIQADDKLTFDVYFPSDLGTLYKVKIGVQHSGESIWQLFHHCKIQNTITLDTFSLSLNETFPLLNGDQWLEFPIEWPLRKVLS